MKISRPTVIIMIDFIFSINSAEIFSEFTDIVAVSRLEFVLDLR